MTDLATRQHDAPLDPAAQRALQGSGLELRLVAGDDRPGFDRWFDAVSRGFFDDERTDAHHQAAFERLAYRRTVGVYDPAAPEPAVPVGTFASWMADLSVPGGAGLPACAISAVTVSPAHRRRGIARAMMEGELRAAAAAGVPMAMLTVSESTIYGRYGFAPAAAAAAWTIESRRAQWRGPVAPGRVDFISRERALSVAPAVHERARLATPGEIEMPRGHWERMVRLRPDANEPGKVRALQYADTGGEVRGVALYTVTENGEDFTKSRIDVIHLLAEDADAYAALWRHFLQMDLISEVKASELSVDEPLLWMITDQRAVTVKISDHQYLRILDVPASLTARRYGAPGLLALDVGDPLGIAEARVLLEVDASGSATVSPWEGEAPDGAVTARLGVAELSAVYLGAVSPATLAAAGRVETSDAAALARVLSWHTTARLSFWY